MPALVFGFIAHDPRKFYTYDSQGYELRALNLLRHGVFSSDERAPFAPDLRRTPIYPAFVAAVYAVVGQRPDAVALLQIVLGSLAALLAFSSRRRSRGADRSSPQRR